MNFLTPNHVIQRRPTKISVALKSCRARVIMTAISLLGRPVASLLALVVGLACLGETPFAQTEFNLHQYVDLVGDDIIPWLRNLTLEGCKRACASNSQCQAFTFNVKHSVCIQKYGYGQPQVNEDAISGSVRPIVGIDYEGGDLDDGQRGVSVDQCLALCSTNPRCVGFAYVRAKNWCWQKAQLMRPTVKPDVVSWTKGPTILITPAQRPLGPEAPARSPPGSPSRTPLDVCDAFPALC